MTQLDQNPLGAPPSIGKRRYFTPAEANRAIVLVKRITRDVVRGYGRLVDLHDTIEAAQASLSQTQFELARDEMVHVVESLNHCLEELEAVGVELKDWEGGVVDFPCIVGGREVRLCWRHGEKRVAHWHEVEEGFPQRRGIEELESWELLSIGR